MKVLYFHQHFSSPRGSTGIRSYCMSQSLLERGHKVTMVCGSYLGSNTGLVGPFIKGMRRGNVDGIDVIELELAYANTDSFIRRTITFVKYTMRSIKLVFSEKYDLVFATTTPLTAGIPGFFARYIKNKKFIFEVRDLWPELPKAMGVITNPFVLSLMSLLEWSSYHSAHHLIALSPGIAKGIEKRGVRQDKITLIPNGCDLDIFNTKNEAWRPEKVKASDLLVLYAGTHGIANGLDSVLNAAIELNARGRKDIKILFLGQGRLKQYLIDRSSKECLDNVIFHDPVDKRTLASLMNATDIGLQILANVPSFYYGTSPNKFFDYIAAGLPVLNNYPGWLSDLINDNDCGFSIPPDDPIAFADALESAAENRVDIKMKGEKARLLANKQFDRKMLASHWVDKLENIYEKDKQKGH